MSLNFKIENNIGFVEFDQKDSKVNLLTMEMVQRLDAILDDVEKISHLKALVILSKKDNVFIAGADIKEIEQITKIKDGQGKSQAGQSTFNKLEDLKIPTIAVIDGVALGGGCELILACDYRLATFNDKVKIGLPEVNLGFVPGFGGTYRLPRIVGLIHGMKMILSGKPIDGKKAFKIGLVDKLFPQIGLSAQVDLFISDILAGKTISNKYKRKKKAKGLAILFENSLIAEYLVFSQSRKSVLKLSKGFYPAPLKAIDVVRKTYYLDRAKGMDIESMAFGELAITDISKNLVQVFYLSEKYRKLTIDGAEKIKPTRIGKCGICGAGIMGGGIAQLLSYKGIWVRLKDIHHAAVGQGFKAAADLYQQAVKKRRMTKAQAYKNMARITGTLDYSGFANADIVIEAVVEKMEIKRKVFKELSENVSNNTILATNTSALSVTKMAQETKDPSKVIGFHFFNPVHRMPLVEIITTSMTSKETIVTTLQFAKQLGKIPIIVKDSSGFVVNRILLGYINEAGRILEECGQMVRIDKLITDFGMPMGPFTLSDEVGLDVGVKVLRILEDHLGERFKPIDSFDKAFNKEYFGKKTGKGFYIYGKTTEPNFEIKSLLGRKDFALFNGDEYLKRMIYVMVNEAARCLEEGVVGDPGDIDIGMIFGTGFPPFRGGLLHYADYIGVDRVAGDLEWFASELKDERYRPCSYLARLRDKKVGFYGV